MWFKNITLFTLDDFAMSAEALNAALTRLAYIPCTDLQDTSSGFVAPVVDGDLAYSLNGQYLLALRTEKKVLPASVVREEVTRRAAEWEKQNGFKPGRKTMKEIKEDAYDVLLPKAFSTSRVMQAWIDTNAGVLALDTASQPQADHFIGMLVKAFEMPLKLAPLRTTTPTDAAMTGWVAGEPPACFTIDQDATFAGRSKATVKFSNTTLEAVDAKRQIEDGKRVTSLALTWDDKVSFVLSPNCVLRRLKPLDVLKADLSPKDVDEVLFAANFLLTTGTLTQLVAALVDSLDGIREPEPDLADESEAEPQAEAPSDDDLYERAREIVIGQQKASISLVQRHLRIGYNRAARLLEVMEARQVVSVADGSGNRRVLVKFAEA